MAGIDEQRMIRGGLSPYRRILSLPGSARFSGAGWFGRFPKSSMTLAAVLLVSAYSGSYAVAGAVGGSLALALAVAGPAWSRAMDRFGQARVLGASMLTLTLASSAFTLAVTLGAPQWTWYPLAAALGAGIADVGSAVRSRWSHLLGAGGLRHVALSLESVADEFVFVVAPPLVTVLATAVWPPLGILLALAMGLSGLTVLVRSRDTQPPAAGRSDRGAARGPLPLEVAATVAAFAGIGATFGSFDLSAVAYTEQVGVPATAGLVVAAFALGSVIVGVVVGAARLPGTPLGRFVVCALLFGIVVPVVRLADSVPLLALLALAAGAVTSPLLISGMGLTASVAPPTRLTEALAWPATGLGVGGTIGASTAGLVIEQSGASAGFSVTAVSAVAVAALAVVGASAARVRRAARPVQLPR